jgi:hypothetical protein
LWPSLNRLCHSKTLDFFIASPPQVSESTAQVSSVTCILSQCLTKGSCDSLL